MHNVCLYFAGCKHSDFIPEFAGCERLPDISNGEVELSGRTVGSTATYSCNQGFVLVGSSTRICQSNGQWSGSEPSCGRSQFFTTGAVNSTMACKYPALLLLLRQICLNSLVDVGCGSLPNPSFGRVDPYFHYFFSFSSLPPSLAAPFLPLTTILSKLCPSLPPSLPPCSSLPSLPPSFLIPACETGGHWSNVK